jgi:hypothetical protein
MVQKLPVRELLVKVEAMGLPIYIAVSSISLCRQGVGFLRYAMFLVLDIVL